MTLFISIPTRIEFDKNYEFIKLFRIKQIMGILNLNRLSIYDYHIYNYYVYDKKLGAQFMKYQ